jgi:hypothetical protein
MAKDGNERGVQDLPEGRYDDELLSANWNPVIDLLGWSCAHTASDASRKDSCEVREEDAEAFLGRIYSAGN